MAAYLLDIFNGDWPRLFIVITCIVFMYSILIFLFLVPEPQQVNVIIEDEDSMIDESGDLINEDNDRTKHVP